VTHLDKSWKNEQFDQLGIGSYAETFRNHMVEPTVKISWLVALEDAWGALWGTFIAAFPTVPLKTNDAVERLRHWMLVSTLGAGIDFVLKRLKSIAKYFLWVASNSQTPPPPIPTGTIGRHPDGSLRVPWLSDLAPLVSATVASPRGDAEFKTKFRMKRQAIKRLSQLAKFGRALPPLNQKASYEEALREHEDTLHRKQSFDSDMAEQQAFKSLFSRWFANEKLYAPSDWHFSFSASGSFDTARRDGGRMTDVKNLISRWKDRVLLDIFQFPSVPNPTAIADKAGRMRYVDPLGVSIAKVDGTLGQAYVDKLLAGTELLQQLQLDFQDQAGLGMVILWGSLIETFNLPLPLTLQVSPDVNVKDFEPMTVTSNFLNRFKRAVSGMAYRGENLNTPGALHPNTTTGVSNLMVKYPNGGWEDKFVLPPPTVEALEASVVALPEWGAKLRVVTQSRTTTVILQHLGRSYLYGILRSCSRSTASNHFTIWHWSRYRARDLPGGHVLLSSDFTTYTDLIPLKMASLISEAITERFPVPGWMKSVIALASTPRILVYDGPEGQYCSDRLHTTGVLMGEPMTYAIGSFLNLFLVDVAKWGLRGRNWQELLAHYDSNRVYRPAVALVQNDDLVAVMTRSGCDRYEKLSGLVGLKLSTVHFVSERFATFCEEICLTNKLGKLVHVDQMKTRHLGRFSSQLFLDRASDMDPFLTRGSALSRMLVYYEETSAPYRAMASYHHLVFGSRYKEIRSDLPIWLPSSVGGLSVPHHKGFALVWRKRLSTRFKNLVRYLAHHDTSATGMYVSNLLSGVFSPSYRGWKDTPRWIQFFDYLKEQKAVTPFDQVVEAESGFGLLTGSDDYSYRSPFWVNRKAAEAKAKEKGWVPMIDVLKTFTRGSTFSDALRGKVELQPVRVSDVIKRWKLASKVAMDNPNFFAICSKSKFIPKNQLSITSAVSGRARWWWIHRDHPLVKACARVGVDFNFHVDRKSGQLTKPVPLSFEVPGLVGLFGIDSLGKSERVSPRLDSF
jgi:hypothetical protein